MVYADICVVDIVVHMATVNNSDKIWYVLIFVSWTTWYTWLQSIIATKCVVYNTYKLNNKKELQTSEDPEAQDIMYRNKQKKLLKATT